MTGMVDDKPEIAVQDSVKTVELPEDVKDDKPPTSPAGEVDIEHLVAKMKLKENEPRDTQVSKSVTWILRHGDEDRVGFAYDDSRFVKTLDMFPLVQKITKVSDYNMFIKLLEDSNVVKQRYVFKELDGVQWMAACRTETLPGTSIKATTVKDTKWQSNMGLKTRTSKSDEEGEGEGEGEEGGKEPATKCCYEVLPSPQYDMVIVRADISIDSQEIHRLKPGDIVEREQDEVVWDDGIIRVKILVPGKNITGWVTKDATKAQGPKFLKEIDPSDLKARMEEQEKKWQESDNERGGGKWSHGGKKGRGKKGHKGHDSWDWQGGRKGGKDWYGGGYSNYGGGYGGGYGSSWNSGGGYWNSWDGHK